MATIGTHWPWNLRRSMEAADGFEELMLVVWVELMSWERLKFGPRAKMPNLLM